MSNDPLKIRILAQGAGTYVRRATTHISVERADSARTNQNARAKRGRRYLSLTLSRKPHHDRVLTADDSVPLVV